jgi:hypothetical protein
MQAKATEMKSAANGWTWRDGTAAFAAVAEMCGVDATDADALKALRGRIAPNLAGTKWSEITEGQYADLVERAVMKSGETQKETKGTEATEGAPETAPIVSAEASPSIPGLRVTKIAAHVLCKRTANYQGNEFQAAMEVAVDGVMTPAEMSSVYDLVYDELTAIIERQHAAHAVSLQTTKSA